MALVSLTSCNDWLDVRPETEDKEEDIFSNYAGYKSALTGCYMALADRNAYGEKLTMTHIESMANLWQMPSSKSANFTSSALVTDSYLRVQEYESDQAKAFLQGAYDKLFNVITQANLIIKYAENSTVFPNEKYRDIICGEAYALRAFCQFDILRMFGQIPDNGGSKKVSLPYSYTTQLSEVPAYYSYEDYVNLLKEDLKVAEERLTAGEDPILENGFNAFKTDDDFYMNRAFRLNAYAVKALKARLSLYIGEKTAAHIQAMELINAKAGGNTALPLSGQYDLKPDNMFCSLPTEALFKLSKYDINDYAKSLLIGASSANLDKNWDYVLTPEYCKEMFAGVDLTSDNRYLRQWNREHSDLYGNPLVTTMKYYYDDKDLAYNQRQEISTSLQVIPMIRMSEVYLIAIESADNLSEANKLYKDYMVSHEILLDTDKFASLDEIRPEMLREYRREFFGEGQMFYTYKRMAATSMIGGEANYNTMGDEQYIAPLPVTEYDPSVVKK